MSSRKDRTFQIPTIKAMKNRKSKTFSYSVFYEQAPEGGYVEFVRALPGCHTQGETLEETERNVKEAIAVYLESMAARPQRSELPIALS
jgi:predicted RNase H-like HicB family nuclease